MCSDLLTCKDGTQQLYTSEEFPMNENRKKTGVMQLQLKFWIEKGYKSLATAAQNLREKLAQLEKTCKVKALHLTNELQEQRESSEQRQDNGEAETEDQPSDRTTTKVVSHQWIAKTLEIHGIKSDLIHLIESVMTTRNIKT